MQSKRNIFLFAFSGLALIAISALALFTVTPASAQCGSQASSCKNFHEVQGEMPVNNDGTSWHTSHAFGDFCYICHAGNNQAKDKAEAHTGMVAPLADVEASCLQCHPADLTERAQVYATALGVEIGAGSAAPAGGESASVAQPASGAASASVPASSEINYDDPNLVNYAARYEEIVLGRKPFNWGNAILLGMIGLVAVGGGGYVMSREKLMKLTFGEVAKAEGEYPAEVVEMLPALSNLKPGSRKALKSVLANPKAEKVLGLMDAVVSDEKNEE